MQTCCHGNMHAFSRGFGAKLLTPTASQPARHTDTLSPRHSLSLSLFLYLSISPFPSLPPSLSLSLSVSLSLSLSLCRSPLLSSVCRQGKSCKKQIRRWVKTRMPPAKMFLGTIPQISRSRQTPRLGEKTAAASRLWRAWQKASNSCGESRAAASARKCVLQAMWRASPTSVRPGFLTSSDEA